jgi:hypothetical protein
VIDDKKQSPSSFSSDIIIESENTPIKTFNIEPILELNLLPTSDMINTEITNADNTTERHEKTKRSKIKKIMKDLSYDIGILNKRLTRSAKKINKREFSKYEKMIDKKRKT